MNKRSQNLPVGSAGIASFSFLAPTLPYILLYICKLLANQKDQKNAFDLFSNPYLLLLFQHSLHL